ncbi:RNA-binding protein 42 [Coemansia sp. RSA 1694]|nr:RNA-binding protein 42 [Coemansia sp. RSA 1694]
MLPSKNRVQAKRILQAPRAVAHSAAPAHSTATVLSAEPVLHRNPIEQSSSLASGESAPAAPGKPSATASYAPVQTSGYPLASSAAGDTLGEQYTYVTDDSGYTWLYDTIYGQYYYYDPAQGTYVPYGSADGAGLAVAAAAAASSSTTEPAAGTTSGQAESAGKGKHAKKRRIVRMAGGQVWEDSTLDEWPADDYRLFVGDLGPEVTTELLEQVFGKFRTMQRALVVVDKKTGKSRGYGFLSFGDPDEFLAAWKQFNGKYVGSRPISLRKSSWKDRNVDIRKAKRQDSRAFLDYKHGK